MSTTVPDPRTREDAAPIDEDEDLREARAYLTADLNLIIGEVAGRDDVLLDVVWGRGDNVPPAWFAPAPGPKVTINGDVALGDVHPDEVDPTTPYGRREHPTLIGMCCHEGGHAHSSTWRADTPPGTPRVVLNAAALLEEPRVEFRQTQRRPGDRLYLRASARHILIPPRPEDASFEEDQWRAASAAALILGRVDAGILTAADTDPLQNAIRTTLGADLLDTLRELWRGALMLDDGDAAGLLHAAHRWIAALDIHPDTDPGRTGMRLPGPACASSPDPAASGEDGAAVDTADPIGEMVAAVTEAAAELAEEEAARDVMDARDDPDTAALTAKAAETQDREDAARDALAVFRHGYSRAAGSPVTGTRPANGRERAAANRLADELRRARHRDRVTRVVASEIPPGRIVGREVLLGAAQRAMGQPVTARPFRRREKRHGDEPPLSVGIAVDVSGSMEGATAAMSSAAWITAQATHRVGGRSATVTFGTVVTPIVPPGRPPEKVTMFRAPDGMEEFTGAVRALDGALNLAPGRGARLLVIASDGVLVEPGQWETGQRLITRLVHSGAGVIWLDFDGRARVMDGVVRVMIAAAPDAATAIGVAARQALASA
jgi:hypothetical protein